MHSNLVVYINKGDFFMNRTVLIGRIVRDIQMRQLEKGQLVMNNVIAVNRLYKQEGQQEADFIPFVSWGKKAELIEQFCAKGDLIGLEGKLQSRKYEDKDGETKYVIELNVDNIQFLQPKKEESIDFIKELSK